MTVRPHEQQPEAAEKRREGKETSSFRNTSQRAKVAGHEGETPLARKGLTSRRREQQATAGKPALDSHP